MRARKKVHSKFAETKENRIKHEQRNRFSAFLSLGIIIVVIIVLIYLFHLKPSSETLINEPTQLMKSAFKGDLKTVVDLTKRSSILSTLNAVTTEKHETVLHVTLRGAYYLLDYQSNVIGNHNQILRHLIKLGADTTKGSLCPLFHAVTYRNTEAMQILLGISIKELEKQFCLTQRDKANNTVLHLASRSRVSEFGKYYFKRLSTAANQVLELLRVNPLPAKSEYTFKELNEAIAAWDVQYLLDAGASPESIDRLGRTPLMVAAAEGNIQAVKYLLSAKPNVNRQDNYGLTALHLASSKNFADIVKLLIVADSVSEIKDNWNRTPLDVAILSRSTEACMVLDETKSSCKELFDWNHDKLSGIHTLSNGDWNPNISSDVSVGAEFVNQIDIVNATSLTFDEFLRSYVSVSKPVILKGLTSNWSAWDNWKRTNMITRYGDITVPFGEVPYGNSYGLAMNSTKLKDFINYMGNEADTYPLSVYDGQILTKAPYLFFDFSLPHQLDFSAKVTQFSIGPARSGYPPNIGSDKWNALIYGKQRWFIFPPSHSFLSKKHVMKWFVEDYPRVTETHFEFVQEAGDIVYIPSGWGHATINMCESVALCVEFDS